MEFAFVLDPLPSLKAYKDSSVAMMRALAARGHHLFALEPADIFWDSRGTQASVVPLTLEADNHPWYSAGEPEVRRVKYGLTTNIQSYNPLRIAYHEMADIAGDVRHASGLRSKLHHVFGRPGWTPAINRD